MEYLYILSPDKIFDKKFQIQESEVLKAEEDTPKDRGFFASIYDFIMSFLDAELYQNAYLEFVISFIFAYFGQAALLSLGTDQSVTIMGKAFSQALILGFLIFITIDTTGGCVNPLVTFGLWTSNKINFSKMVCYCIAQFSGMILSQLALIPTLGLQNAQTITIGEIAGAYLGDQTTNTQCFILEFFTSFWFIYIIHAAAADDTQAKLYRPKKLSPFMIAAACFIGIISTGGLIEGATGGCFNPARALGPALASRNYEKLWIYILAPASAAFVQSAFYRCMQPFTRF